MQRRRHQRGHVYQASDGFYVRYYASDGSKRVQRSHKLADATPQYFLTKRNGRKRPSPALQELRDRFMLTVNAPQSTTSVKITDFWQAFYLPWAEETFGLKPSTIAGYKQVWQQHLKPHFGDVVLSEYRTSQARLFLEGLGQKYGKRVVLHIKNLGSAIFRRALELEMVAANPWSAIDCRRIKAQTTAETQHYTLEEAENIVSALVDRVDAQLLFALAFWEGLRPSEIVGLQWNDIDTDNLALHIRRAVVRRVVGPTKTLESMTEIPIIEPVRTLLTIWRPKCPPTNKGWVFPNERSVPYEPREFCRCVIRPRLGKARLVWKGLYAGRRGGATDLVERTGSLVAAQELLRHKSMTTTAQFYKKRTLNGLNAGMKALEAATKALAAATETAD